MNFKLLLFYIVILINNLIKARLYENKKLLMAIEISRHGARSPLH